MTDHADDRLAQLRRFIDHRLAWDSAEFRPARRPGPAVFVLCPPRSGSTLLVDKSVH
jgi:hypothetical protein